MARTTSTENSPQSFADLRGKKKARVISQPILMDPELAEVYESTKEIYDEVNKRRLLSGRDVPEELEKEFAKAKRDLVAAEKAVEASTYVFRFKAIGRAKMEELLGEYPPTKKQLDEAKDQGNPDLSYNPELFPQALIAEAAVEPKMTLEEVTELWDDPDWTTTELVILFSAAQRANVYVDIEKLKKGFGQTHS